MAFLKATVGLDSYEIRGAFVGLRPLHVGDYAAWARLRAANRDHLQPFEPVWPPDELLKNAFRRRLRHYAREQREDTGYAYGVFKIGDDELLGGISLSNVRRGVTQAAQLGYWLGLEMTGRGYMTDAVAALATYAFFGLRLNRVEAATLPTNAASIAVLERNGFLREGYARRYLKINGEWRDHILFALLADEHQARPSDQRQPTGAAR